MAGIYIHVPFCKTHCLYCDFYSTVNALLRQRYTDALCLELRMRHDYLKGEPVKTVYLGGGTPTQLEPQQLRKCMSFKYPVSVPSLNADKLAKTAAELEGAITKPLTREYVSSIFYDAISGAVKTEIYSTHFTDINPYSSGYEAILYLEDLGVINGYGDDLHGCHCPYHDKKHGSGR